MSFLDLENSFCCIIAFWIIKLTVNVLFENKKKMSLLYSQTFILLVEKLTCLEQRRNLYNLKQNCV